MESKTIIGWREWVKLPELGIKIKAKIDTGARTSVLHAFRIRTFKEHNKFKIEFTIHPSQKNIKKIITCVADIIDYRWVTDSGGHREQRYVIKTLLAFSETLQWPIEITLTNRDNMRFRMLLGRTALNKKLIIDPSVSYKLKE